MEEEVRECSECRGSGNKLSLQEVQDAVNRLKELPAKYVIMSTDKDGNPIITALPAIESATSIDTCQEYV